jgi:dolichol-phosphate mannosyltransferase
MLLSVVIPAFNEADCIYTTTERLSRLLTDADIHHEIVIVNDHSTDCTTQVLAQLTRDYPQVRWLNNERSKGFGYTIRTGLEATRGDAICILMADASDDPSDVVRYYRKLEDGYDCVFGSRFIKSSRVVDYPIHKLIVNRLANVFIMTLFGIRYNDVTNAFKCYRREVITGLQPIISAHFNLTVELPLKAIVRGYKYEVIPINWYNRQTGISKLKIKEMGSRYMFIVLYVLLEKLLVRTDYARQAPVSVIDYQKR